MDWSAVWPGIAANVCMPFPEPAACLSTPPWSSGRRSRPFQLARQSERRPTRRAAPCVRRLSVWLQFGHPTVPSSRRRTILVYRLIDAYPRRDIALFEKYFVKFVPGKELSLFCHECGLATKFGGTWIDDRGGGTTRLSFDAKGRYRLWFAYEGSASLAYSSAYQTGVGCFSRTSTVLGKQLS